MCSYCGVDGHTRDVCPDRQEYEVSDRQLEDPLEVCPECGRAVNRSVNQRCWGGDCEYDFTESELRTDGAFHPRAILNTSSSVRPLLSIPTTITFGSSSVRAAVSSS